MQEKARAIQPRALSGPCIFGGREPGDSRDIIIDIPAPIMIRPGTPQKKENASFFVGFSSLGERERLFFFRIKYHKRARAGIEYVNILINSRIAENVIKESMAGAEEANPGKKRTR